MEYLKPAEDRELEGQRLVLTRGMPAPCSMSARAMFDRDGSGCDPILIEQRDRIFASHLSLPMSF